MGQLSWPRRTVRCQELDCSVAPESPVEPEQPNAGLSGARRWTVRWNRKVQWLRRIVRCSPGNLSSQTQTLTKSCPNTTRFFTGYLDPIPKIFPKDQLKMIMRLAKISHPVRRQSLGKKGEKSRSTCSWVSNRFEMF